jgi:formamidopyrimidine-DNA glycosylase
MLKPLLLDQSVIAGLGNIYVDEALWEASLHPCRIASTLSDTETRKLRKAIVKVLKQGIKNMGTTLGNGKANFQSASRRAGRNREHLNVFHRTGQPCPRCNATVERITVAQRGTHICPKCQK